MVSHNETQQSLNTHSIYVIFKIVELIWINAVQLPRLNQLASVGRLRAVRPISSKLNIECHCFQKVGEYFGTSITDRERNQLNVESRFLFGKFLIPSFKINVKTQNDC